VNTVVESLLEWKDAGVPASTVGEPRSYKVNGTVLYLTVQAWWVVFKNTGVVLTVPTVRLLLESQLTV